MFKCTNNDDCKNDYTCCASCHKYHECIKDGVTCWQLNECSDPKECPYSREE